MIALQPVVAENVAFFYPLVAALFLAGWLSRGWLVDDVDTSTVDDDFADWWGDDDGVLVDEVAA